MSTRIKIDELSDALQDRILLDVRTPAEFDQGHIPGARSLPLFSNEERAEVGTLYKQVSPDQAFLRGLEFAGARMRAYVEEARRLAPWRKVVVHCWRGGQRSSSMGWLLESAGFDVQVLAGGYKAFRQYLHFYLAQPHHPLVILGGRTGTGKTKILQAIGRLGEQIVDLEAMAHHKGSAFGALGEAPQPTVEQFENDLYFALRRIPAGERLWLEDESRSIGRTYIPQPFWERMMAAPLIYVDMPLELRVENLVEDYGRFPREALAASFERITKRLGGQHVKAALEALERDDLATAAEIALRYYDKAYDMTVSRREPSLIYRLAVTSRAPEVVARAVLHQLQLVENNS